jgi:hypothetical protein
VDLSNPCTCGQHRLD